MRTTVGPYDLAVVGAGPAGLIAAQVAVAAGARVALIEAADRLLPGLDADVGAAVARQLSADGVEVLCGIPVTGASPSEGGPRLEIGPRRDALTVEGVIVAVGRRPVTDGLALSAARVETGGSGAFDSPACGATIVAPTSRPRAAISRVAPVPGLQHRGLPDRGTPPLGRPRRRADADRQ